MSVAQNPIKIKVKWTFLKEARFICCDKNMEREYLLLLNMKHVPEMDICTRVIISPLFQKGGM